MSSEVCSDIKSMISIGKLATEEAPSSWNQNGRSLDSEIEARMSVLEYGWLSMSELNAKDA